MIQPLLTQREQTKRMTNRTVKYSSDEKKVMERFILLQLPLCKAAVDQKKPDKQRHSITGAADYIIREVAREKSALKTKFNKFLKMERCHLCLSPNDICICKDSGDSLEKKASKPDNACILIPLTERSFVKDALRDMLTSYNKAQEASRGTRGSKSIGGMGTMALLQSNLGKRNMDDEAYVCYPPYKDNNLVNFGDDHHAESDTVLRQLLGYDSIAGPKFPDAFTSVDREPNPSDSYLQYNTGYQRNQISINMYNEAVESEIKVNAEELEPTLMFQDYYESMSKRSFDISDICQ